MKKITLILILSMVVVFSAEAHKYKKSHITISVQTFYDQLSPYGDWIYSPDYGYVWRPYFDNPASFRPYSSNGNWVYTDYGWTWASGYDWGWATFHYGRWDFDNYLGWMWIPGYEWAPAWVSWGSYDNYWGWAPMGPNIYVQSNWYAPDPWWTFVPQNRFCSNNWNRYIYDRPVHVNHITHITNVYVDANNRSNHNSWYYGPRVNDVERYSKSKVTRMEVGESQRPEKSGIHNNRLDVYRPKVESASSEHRPNEYRNVEQARSGKRIEQTNPRTNDPGTNRTRDTRTETRTTKQATIQGNGNVRNDSRISPRTSSQNSNSRTVESTNKSREIPRTKTQPEQRNSSSSRNTQVEQRNGSQASPDRNSSRSNVESRNTPPRRESNSRVTDKNPAERTQSKVENRVYSQPAANAPASENVNNSASRTSGNRQTTSTQPAREQRSQNASPSSNTRIVNSEKQQTTQEEGKKAVKESRRPVENTGNRASGNPSRR